MTPRSILAVTDFSVHGHNTLDRAALLSAEHGAALRLAYLSYPGETPPADAATRLSHHALQLSQLHRIEVSAVSRLFHVADDLLPEARAADLIVWGTASVRSPRSFFFGQPAEELIRRVRRPVLVVRRSARHTYRRVLVAVDFSAASRALVDLGVAVGKKASLELFHAVSTAFEGKLRYAEVSDGAVHAYREHGMKHAKDQMSRLIDSSGSMTNGVRAAVAHGDPSRLTLAQQHRSASELIVVGKHPCSTISDLLFGSVANRILRFSEGDHGRTDVLVVPHDWEEASSAFAARRLAPERPSVRRVRAGAPTALDRPSATARGLRA